MPANITNIALDTPVAVQGYVTDPKFVGYQILNNYESTYWRALIGNDAWGLYEVLRSFCHEGNNECYPSIRLLTSILGLKEKRVLTGWAKKVNGKEYQYPGLIETLQKHGLTVAEVQGEGPKMHYTFHVNLTPGLLSKEELAQLPSVLQKRHEELLERTEKAKQKMEAKKRPSKFPTNQITNGTNGQGGGNLPPGGGNLPGGGGNLPPKQQQDNNTQLTATSALDEINNNSSDSATTKEAVVVALISLGITKGVAQRLASRYSENRIREKIGFLEFLQKQQPDKVKNPKGWLRKAIEENYAGPDGYKSAEQIAKEEEAKRHQEEEISKQLEIATRRRREEMEEVKDERLVVAQARYGTTERETKLWRQALEGIRDNTTEVAFQMWVEGSHLLVLKDGKAVIGALSAAAQGWLEQRLASVIKRELENLVGEKLELQFVEIDQEDESGV